MLYVRHHGNYTDTAILISTAPFPNLNHVHNTDSFRCAKFSAEWRENFESFGRFGRDSGASMRRIAMAQLLWLLGQNVRMFSTRRNHDDLAAIGRLIESGKLRSIIDRTYPLAEAAAAIAYVEAGHARGKVLVTVG